MSNTKSQIDFPCHFPIKIIGNNRLDFVERIQHIIIRHFPDFDRQSARLKQSKNKNYVSLTITVYAKNQSHLDAFYREISSHPEVHMLL